MSDLDLSGRVALVTGGSRGIGRAICLELARHGARVAVNYNSSPSAAEEVVGEIISAGGEAFPVKCNIAEAAEVQAMIKEVVAHFGGLDILVNNAGVTRDGLLMRMSEEDYDEVANINQRGAFLVTKAAIRPLLRSKFGRIIFISSVVGIMGNPGQFNYAATKAALIAMAKVAAKELGPRGITSNAIAPGFILTDILNGMEPAMIKTAASHIPLERGEGAKDDVEVDPKDKNAMRDNELRLARHKLGVPEDIAAAVVYLASDMASYITATTLKVDGGMVPL